MYSLCIHSDGSLNVPKTQSVTALKPDSLTARAYAALRDAVEGGDLVPGEPLYEVHLGERLGMSRTPVREALKLLARDGFLELLPSRGYAVPRRSLDDIREFFEVREALEATASRYAALRATAGEIAQLEKLCERYAREANWERWNRIGTDFHNVVIDAARNARLRGMLRSLNAQIVMSRRSATGGDPERRKQAVADHKAIFAAIKARDGKRAELLAAAHVRRAYEATMAGAHSRAYATAA